MIGAGGSAAVKDEIEKNAALFNPARHLPKKEGFKNMEALNLTLTVLAWIAFAVVLYALWPFLLKLLITAQHLHNLGM